MDGTKPELRFTFLLNNQQTCGPKTIIRAEVMDYGAATATESTDSSQAKEERYSLFAKTNKGTQIDPAVWWPTLGARESLAALHQL